MNVAVSCGTSDCCFQPSGPPGSNLIGKSNVVSCFAGSAARSFYCPPAQHSQVDAGWNTDKSAARARMIRAAACRRQTSQTMQDHCDSAGKGLA
jgi:hypothetical protein